MARKHLSIPRTVYEARKMGHPAAEGFEIKALGSKAKRKWMEVSSSFARPGDVAWVGPCEGDTRIVCYYDANMDPSDCHNQPCEDNDSGD